MFHKMMNYGEVEARPSILLTKDIVKKSLPKFKRHDDMIIVQACAWEEFKKSLPIPVVKNENSPFSIDEDELASLVCQCVQKPVCRRLAIERGVKNDDYRTPGVEILLGESGVVNHNENQIRYRFDVTKCMFSFGNIREKMRMAKLDCSHDIVVDLFAGIGYFSLPLLIHANAKHLYACEWNPDAVEALRKNMLINKVDSSRYTIIEGDNRSNRPTDVAQRVILGILPSCMAFMKTAFECIDKSTGAILHCHDLVEVKVRQKSNNSVTASPLPTDCPEDPSNQAEGSTSLDISNNSRNGSESNGLHASPSQQQQQAQTPDTSPIQSNTTPMLSKSPNNGSITTLNSTNSTTNSIDQQTEPQVLELDGSDLSIYEARGAALIASISEDLEAHDLEARIINIEPVKSYAPHVNHVVFDIWLALKSATNNSSNNGKSSGKPPPSPIQRTDDQDEDQSIATIEDQSHEVNEQDDNDDERS